MSQPNPFKGIKVDLATGTMNSLGVSAGSPEKMTADFKANPPKVEFGKDFIDAIDPPPFDMDKLFAEWNSKNPLERMADHQQNFAGIVETIARPFKAQGYNTLAAWNRGWGHFSAHLDLVSQFLEKRGIGNRSGLFDKVADEYEQNSNYYAQKAREQGMGFFDELISNAVGELVPGTAQFMLDVKSGLTMPFMAGYQKAENEGKSPLEAGLVEAAKTGVLHGIFKLAAPLALHMRAPVLGVVGGTQAAVEAPEGQKTQAFLTGGLTMAAYAASSPGGRYGLNEVIESGKNLLNTEISPALRRFAADESGFLKLPTKSEFEKGWEFTMQRGFNRFQSIENLDAKAEKLGVTLQPGESPKNLSRSFLGLVGKARSVLEDKTYTIGTDGKVQITGEGLQPIIRDYERISPEADPKIRTQEFNDYFVSRRRIEDLQRLNDRGEKIASTEQTASAYLKLAMLKQKYGNLDHFEAVADRFYQYNQRVAHLLVDSGNMSEAQYQTMIADNPHYARFQKVIDEADQGTSGGSSKKPFDETRSPLKRIKGGEYEMADVLESTIKSTYQIMNVAERNRVSLTIAKKFADNPVLSEALGITRKAPDFRPIKIDADEIKTISESFTTRAREIKRESTKTTEGASGESPTTGPMKRLEQIVVDSLMSRGMTEGEASTALVKIKNAAAKNPSPTGTTTIERTIESVIKETVNIIETPTDQTIWRPSVFKPEGNIVEFYENGKKKYMEVPKNIHEAMTGMNEVSLDMFTRAMGSASWLLRRGVTMTPEYMARNFVRDNITNAIQTAVGFKPIVDPVEVAADIIGRKALYYDWLRSGAAQAGFVELSRRNLERMTLELKKDPSAWNYLNVFEDLSKVSEFLEAVTRVGVFKAGKEFGLSDIEAGVQSREGGTDFGVHGSSRFIRRTSATTAFFNPSLQGFSKFIRSHKEQPVGMALKSIGWVTIPTIIMWMANQSDPDTKDKVKDKQRWQQDMYWTVPFTGGRGQIAKPQGIGQVYGSSVERFLDWAVEKDPRAFKDFSKTLIESASPMQGDPSGVLIPTAVKGLVENGMNYSFFREGPVEPQSKEKRLPEQRFGASATETAKEMAKLGIFSKMGYSPAQIENLVRNQAGGMGMYAMEATDLMLEQLGAKKEGSRPIEASDMPFLKAFWSKPTETNAQSLNDFYDEAQKLEQQYSTFRDYYSTGNYKDAARVFKAYPKLMLSPLVQSRKEAVANFNKIIDAFVKSDLPNDKKKEAISAAEKLRNEVAKITLKGLDAGSFEESMKAMQPSTEHVNSEAIK